jgi:hypothetical protein
MDELLAGAPPDLGLLPRAGTLAPAEVRARAARVDAPAPRREALLGLALLWHDDWEGAHAVAQEREGLPDFDLLHAVLHRREGDFGNSRYWFRSAGSHPCFPPLASALDRFLVPDHSLRRTLLPKGKWSPEGFVAEVAAATRAAPISGASEKTTEAFLLLKRVQELEIRAFGAWLVST